MASDLGMLPLVFMPQIHTSALGWLDGFNALGCATLFQWVPDENLAKAIRHHFRFGHALWVPDPEHPPSQVLRTVDAFLARLPDMLAAREARRAH